MTDKEKSLLAAYKAQCLKNDVLCDMAFSLIKALRRQNNLEELGFEALLSKEEEKKID